MTRPLLFAISSLLLVPLLAATLPARADSGRSAAQVAADGGALPAGFAPFVPDRLRVLENARRPETRGQVRVEQRIVIRVSPSSEALRSSSMARLPRRAMRSQFEEVDHGDCVEVEDLAAVQPLDERHLLLITRDRQMLTAALDRTCSARAFYSGFYLDRNEDGKLCVARDRLRSRAGASCEVAGFGRLVAARE